MEILESVFGVIGDLTGFAAAVTKRGIDFIQIPTTLLAQVDSSVGGKTGINTRQGKNFAGAFHQPRLVIADTALLATLPERERRSGYAEIVKAALIGDEAMFDRLDAAGAALRDEPEAAVLGHHQPGSHRLTQRSRHKKGRRGALLLPLTKTVAQVTTFWRYPPTCWHGGPLKQAGMLDTLAHSSRASAGCNTPAAGVGCEQEKRKYALFAYLNREKSLTEV